MDHRDHIIQIVKDLQPQIHYLAFFIRLLTWQEHKSHTILMICSCILIQHYYKSILLLFPLICFCTFKYYQHPTKYTKKQNALLEDLTDILQFISNMKSTIQRIYNKYSNSLSIQSCLFIGVYATWIILLQHCNVWWSPMMLVLFVHSPWFPFIQHACTSPFNGHTKHDTLSSNSACHDRVYCFEVYQHQRWWFPAGWSNLLLPQDPPVWSDTHLEPTPSIYNFTLPPATTTEQQQQKRVTWVWMDPEWRTTGDGWEYGNWQWKNWGARPGRLGICTRRRKWYRCAQRVVEDAPLDEEQESSISECDTCVDNMSVISTTTPSPKTAYSHVVSFDNKGEKMLRRRSSNKTISMELHTIDIITPKRLKRFSI